MYNNRISHRVIPKYLRHTIAKTPELGTSTARCNSGGVRDLSGDDLSSNDKVISRHILSMYSITGLSENCKKRYMIILIGHWLFVIIVDAFFYIFIR